ncbi:MAG TPA: hypothetical protein VFS71_08230 [Flavobacterium sp.]|uniref:hypothetical protein n=1 Tax=Flavobacterium sp. TaxID=239 RepID=UPI002DB89210|nr:hypothetical protein [Flavobacterium sp.]HEU4789655.1 hypothetical protein [Flavobacterium sp.]
MIKTIKKINNQTWIAILGGTILFLSWIVEKKFESNWINEKQKLERSQLVIDITEVQRANYEVAYNVEAKKEKQDLVVLTFIQVGLCRTYINLLSWSKGRITDDAENYKKIINSKREIDSTNISSYNSGNYEKVHYNFEFVKSFFEKNYLDLDNQFSVKVDEVDAKQNLWNIIFTLLYVLGSLLVGVSFVLEKTSPK